MHSHVELLFLLLFSRGFREQQCNPSRRIDKHMQISDVTASKMDLRKSKVHISEFLGLEECLSEFKGPQFPSTSDVL